MAKKQESTIDALKQKIDSVQEKLNDAKDTTEDFIADHPFTSTLVAFGVGVVAGVVITKLLEKK